MIATTQEQSQRLLRCGVSADTADMSWRTILCPSNDEPWADPQLSVLSYSAAKDIYGDDYVEPAWSLSALMTKVLPNKIDFRGGPCLLEVINSNWQSDEQIWEVAYDIDLGVDASDPIEACVLMAEKLVANGYKLNDPDCPCREKGGEE